MSCKKFRVEIEEAGQGATLGAAAAKHTATCASCRALRADREALRALVAELARVDAPADFEFRLRARMARTEEATHTFSLRRAFVPGAAWLAVAGCLVLALGVFVHFHQPQNQSQQIASSGTDSTGTVAVKKTPPAEEATPRDGNEPTNISDVATTDKVNRNRVASRLTRAPRAGKFVLPNDAVEEIAGAQPAATQLESHSLESKSSPIYIGSPIPLPVTTQERRLEALFKDMRGAQRVVAVDPVTFGARERTPQRASMKTVSSSGVW
jgi:hypothetical protein